MSRNHRQIEMDLALSSSSSSSSKPYGSSRSIVRRIATNLPLAPCARVHFQLHPFTSGAGFLNNSNGPNGLVATLADVGWIEREEGDDTSRNSRLEAGSGLFFRNQECRPLRRQRSLPSLHQTEPAPQSQKVINDEAIQKIGVLETELAKLRAQIAQIVQAQEQSAQSTAPAPGGPPVPQAPPMAPPPPPPPPPCPAPGIQRTYSAIDLIRERRGKKAEENMVLDSAPKKPELPNMLDVLKDIGKVKLRSVKSQEDGHPKPKPVEPTDAAALIAEALKRKFAYRYRSDSECDASFNLPAPENKTHVETPLFGQHLLKSTGKKKLY